MPRSTKPNVSVVERIRWLNELERGKGITEISKAAGRDIRIVKRHIEAAREERVWAQARAEFLRSRLERHQEDILDQVQECRAICARPDPTAITGFDLNRRNRPRMYQALQEHLSRLDVKQQWNTGFSKACRKSESIRGTIISVTWLNQNRGNQNHLDGLIPRLSRRKG